MRTGEVITKVSYCQEMWKPFKPCTKLNDLMLEGLVKMNAICKETFINFEMLIDVYP